MKRLFLAAALLLAVLPAQAQAPRLDNSANQTLNGVTLPAARTTGLGIPTFNPVSDHAAPTDGVTNAATAITASFTDCTNAGGGRVVLPPKQFVYSGSDLTIPAGCSLEFMAHPVVSHGGATYDATQPAIILDSAHTIQLYGRIEHTAIFSSAIQGLAQGTIQQALAWQAAFAGTAITVQNGGTVTDDVLAIGFTNCFVDTGTFPRLWLEHFQGNCKNGPILANVFDVGWIGDINLHTFMPVGSVASATLTVTGAADNGSGTVRLTVSGSTASFATGNPGWVYNVGGFTGANACAGCTITVFDGTHIDLQGILTAPSTTGTWISGSRFIAVASTTGLGLGQTITGVAGIPNGSSIDQIDWMQSLIHINTPTTAAGSSVSITFANPAYTSGGSISLEANLNMGTAFNVTATTGMWIHDIFEYGWTTGYHAGATAESIIWSSAACDFPAVNATASVCMKWDSTSYANQWLAGDSFSNYSTALYDASAGNGASPDRVTGVHFQAPGNSGPTVSIATQDGLVISGSTASNSGTFPIIILTELNNSPLIINGSQFTGTQLLFNDSATQHGAVNTYVSPDSILAGWLFSGGSAEQNLLFNGGPWLDQIKEGATTYAFANNAYTLDQWKMALINAGGGGAATIQRVAGVLPNSTYNTEFVVGTAASVSGTDTWLLYMPIEASAATGQLQWGNGINGQPVTLSFAVQSSVSGLYTVDLVNRTNSRNYAMTFTLTAGVPTEEIFTIPPDIVQALPTSAEALEVQFQLDRAVQSSGSLLAWGTGTGFQATGSVHLMATLGATFYVGNVRLEPGNMAHGYVERAPSEILLLAQRYYRKTFPRGTAVAQSAGVTSALCTKNPIALGDPSLYWQFGAGAPMQATPTIVTYNPSASNANWRDVTASADATVVVDPATAVGQNGVLLTTSGTVATLGDVLCIHATADARL